VDHVSGAKGDGAMPGRTRGAHLKAEAAAENAGELLIGVRVRRDAASSVQGDVRDHRLCTDDAAPLQEGHGAIGRKICPAVDLWLHEALPCWSAVLEGYTAAVWEEQHTERAGDLLREYLAGRDVGCDGCGYNLRGVMGVVCPECGTVIPRPPAEFAQRRRMRPAELRLSCAACGYLLEGMNADRCPECGGADLVRYSGDTPPRPRRTRWWNAWFPFPLGALGVVGLCLVPTCIAIGLGRSLGSIRGGRSLDPWVGAVLALGPPAICIAWVWWRGAIAKLERGERRALAVGAFIVAFLMVGAAMKALR
jgi:predicted RNA-binding Zn-ribbon protein involved in translation (DUF1610 family)